MHAIRVPKLAPELARRGDNAYILRMNPTNVKPEKMLNSGQNRQ